MRRARERVVASWPVDGSNFFKAGFSCDVPSLHETDLSIVAAGIKIPGTKHSQEDSDAAATSVTPVGEG